MRREKQNKKLSCRKETMRLLGQFLPNVTERGLSSTTMT